MITALVLVLVASAVIVLVARRADQRVAEAVERMEAQTLAREAAIDKQAKVFVRRLEQSRRVGERAVDQARQAVVDSQHLRDTANALFSDPRVKRLLDRQEVTDG